ncbi:MAG: hypothetical protein VX793_09145 [Pseudomonadota bacterium]|nr:hypothetical protein [Pseudomonadota bacterium]
MLRLILIATGLLTGLAQAQGYDYIRGDDVYEEDYQYGVDYEGLSSVPRTRLNGADSGQGDDAGGRLKQRARDLQEDTTQPSMTRELERWQARDRLSPATDAGR